MIYRYTRQEGSTYFFTANSVGVPSSPRMRTILHFLSVILVFGLPVGCETTSVATRDVGKTVMVSTFAGSEKGYADGQKSAAQFSNPSGITIDSAGNLYVADTSNYRIRKISPKGEVSTFAGSEKGYADGLRSAAHFDNPFDITIDSAGNLYVADGFNHRIRKILPTGEVGTLAGGKRGYADGSGSAAQFSGPSGITIDSAGNLYVVECSNHRVRKVTPTGGVSTFAGSGMADGTGGGGYADGQGISAQFSCPSGITIDTAGNLYVADSKNHRIRKISPKGMVSTIAGSGVTRSIKGGFADGLGSAAQFSGPSGITMDSAGNLYVVDNGNHRIRKLVFETNPSSRENENRGHPLAGRLSSE